MHQRFTLTGFCSQVLLIGSLAGLCGCDRSQPQTLVTLHNIKAGTLHEVLTKSLGPEVKFSIAENKIIIFEELVNITSTLELLKSLDMPATIIGFHFKRIKQYDYSTLKSPETFFIKESIETKIIVNNKVVRVIFKRVSVDAFVFKVMTKKAGKINKTVFEIKEGTWKKVHLPGLEDFPMIKVERQY